MKERPIIFSTDMVKAILDGTKTQSRRVIKPQPTVYTSGSNISSSTWRKTPSTTIIHVGQPSLDIIRQTLADLCPYGQVGDRLWVREKFALSRNIMVGKGYDVLYWATANEFVRHHYRTEWKPSIHMFRKDSRILLEITEIRAERLKAITVLDLINEGIEPEYEFDTNAYNEPPMFNKFIGLWDSLNAKRGFNWEVTPWVWVIGFKRIRG